MPVSVWSSLPWELDDCGCGADRGLVAASEDDDFCSQPVGVTVWVVLRALVSPSVLVERL